MVHDVIKNKMCDKELITILSKFLEDECSASFIAVVSLVAPEKRWTEARINWNNHLYIKRVYALSMVRISRVMELRILK